jgi:hypothetical protein
MLKLGMFFAIKGNIAQTRSLACEKEQSEVCEALYYKVG